MATGQIFSEYFGFPYQFSFHRLLDTQPSSAAGTVGQLVADVPSGLSLTFTPTKLTTLAVIRIVGGGVQTNQLNGIHTFFNTSIT
jgi:hypothetical protein